MTKPPKVFIVILNHNGKAAVQKCLTSVFKTNYSNFEVVLVDNGSVDGSLEMARTNFSKANFIKNTENLGCAAGNNVGIRFSLERMADYVLVLNGDMEVDKDFLGRLVSVAEKDEKAGVLSPIVFGASDRHIEFSGGKIDWFGMKLVKRKRLLTEDFYESEFVTSRGMLVKAAVFKKIGLFDEDFFLYWEDVDFGFRARKAGFKNMVVPTSWVYHLEKSEKNQKSQLYWQIVSGLIFFKKNIGIWMRPWFDGRVKVKKVQSWLGVKFRRDETALITRKAYVDFKSAKF